MAMQNSPARSGIDVGSVIADTYTIEALIGRGGMGAVFMASHKRLPGKQVAIKVLHAEMSGEEVLARFKREAEIASRLGHPNIVQVHDFNLMPDGTPYLVLEYLHGESLAQRLKQGPLSLEHAMSIVRQVGSALAAAHREGIVHRDLKPQNIFLVPTEVDGRIVEIAKVLDFGISKIRGSTTVKTQDSALLGTPQYMAPEQATGQHSSVDERTDIFALGAIVYEMLSGQPAFSGETIPEVVFKVVYEQPVPLAERVPGLPAAVIAAVQRAMAKPANERFASASDFIEALTGQPLVTTRPGASIPPPDLGFAAGSRAPNTDREAFAQTMGSGDHGPAAAAGLAATSAAPASASAANEAAAGQPSTRAAASAGSANAATASAGPVNAAAGSAGPANAAASAMASTSAAGNARRLGSAPTIDSQNLSGGAPQAPGKSPRRTGTLVAALIGGAALAAAAMYFVMRDRAAPAAQIHDASSASVATAEPPPTVDATLESAPGDAAIVEAASDAAIVGAASDATIVEAASDATDGKSAAPATGSGAAPSHVASKRPPSTASKPDKSASTGDKPASTGDKAASTGDDDDEDDGGDELAAKKLRDATAALEASQWDRAEMLANSVRNSEDASPHQKARAMLVYGMVQCLGRNDDGRAISTARALLKTPRLRRRLLDACHRVNRLRGVR